MAIFLEVTERDCGKRGTPTRTRIFDVSIQ